MNSRNNSTKNINELVKTATNKLDTTTEKVKNNLLQIISNELKHASKRERELMEWEMMLHIWALFEAILSDKVSKKEKTEVEKQYKLYSHLAKELNFEMVLNQLKIHEKLRKKEENKKIKSIKKQLRKDQKKRHQGTENAIWTQDFSGEHNKTGGSNNTGDHYWNIKWDGIFVTGHGNVVIINGEIAWKGESKIIAEDNQHLVHEEQKDKKITSENTIDSSKQYEEEDITKAFEGKEPANHLTKDNETNDLAVTTHSESEKESSYILAEEVEVRPDPEEKTEIEKTTILEEPSIPTPIVPPHIESTPEKKEEVDNSFYDLDASLSNVENIHRENAKYQAEETLKNSYSKLNKYNLFGKAKFFLMRGIMRDKKIKQQMKDAKNWPFSNDKELNSELGKGETLFSGENSERQIKDIPELNKACISFIRGELSETSFQAFFTVLIQN